MSAAEWAIIIGAGGTVLLQIIGRVQAWQLAVIAARTETQAKANQQTTIDKVEGVSKLVDGTTSKLTDQVAELSRENAALRAQVAGYIARDATTAQIAREHKTQEG